MSPLEESPFERYNRESGERARRAYYWATAVGLQDVDHLETSQYLENLARRHIEGEVSSAQAGELIESYYREESRHETGDATQASREREADLVATRITRLLEKRNFTFSSDYLFKIHRELFTEIYDFAGRPRGFNIVKSEWVLDGDTVTYGDAPAIEETLDYDLAREANFDYSGIGKSERIAHLARFVADLWQIHPFAEGNTRTVAVFFIKYLDVLGLGVTNDTFLKHSWFFRNALARANYRNRLLNIEPTDEFLVLFLRHLFGENGLELSNRTMHISGAWNSAASRKPDIGEEKPDIVDLFPRLAAFHSNTRQHALTLFETFGSEGIFGRGAVIELIGLSPSAASELLAKLRNAGVIIPVNGHGKSKYRFAI
ncbi:MAG: Fic family protein [Mobiluncus porci]|uniref:Fic family protein n=2 Tax=Mobiluncus TaxID=2050 RepID=UPI0023F5208C|nr:Fic family protein [Mobiluncus porci]MDD7542300.1 Fic family protein [Mobiluncus porci]MDY5749099.1 Fic family protein [Mobiluncus porci]